jgi:plastocyanin
MTARRSTMTVGTAVILSVGAGLLSQGGALHTHAARLAKAHKTVVTKEVNDKYGFNPKKVTVKVGTTVTWSNKTDAEHNVTFHTDGKKLNADFKPGKSVHYTFTKAGTYLYHCEYHPYMKATIVVTK